MELSAVWLLRRRLGIYIYDVEPFLDFWRGGPLADTARYHHLLLIGPWVIGLVVTLGSQLAALSLGPALVISGPGDGQPWAYLYTLFLLAFVYHLACALLAGRGHRGNAWRWTSSLPVETALILAAIPLSAAPW